MGGQQFQSFQKDTWPDKRTIEEKLCSNAQHVQLSIAPRMKQACMGKSFVAAYAR